MSPPPAQRHPVQICHRLWGEGEGPRGTARDHDEIEGDSCLKPKIVAKITVKTMPKTVKYYTNSSTSKVEMASESNSLQVGFTMFLIGDRCPGSLAGFPAYTRRLVGALFHKFVIVSVGFTVIFAVSITSRWSLTFPNIKYLSILYFDNFAIVTSRQ